MDSVPDLDSFDSVPRNRMKKSVRIIETNEQLASQADRHQTRKRLSQSLKPIDELRVRRGL